MNHRIPRSIKTLLWLVAGVACMVLVVWIMRSPAWATPLSEEGIVAMQSQSTSSTATMTVNQEVGTTIARNADQTIEMQAAPPSSDNCIECHTDKQKLKDLAEEPEEVRSEKASGEG